MKHEKLLTNTNYVLLNFVDIKRMVSLRFIVFLKCKSKNAP